MVSAFITITNPEQRGDTFEQCYASAKDIFDEVIIIDGKDTWPQEFDWKVIGEHFQKGYEACSGDMVVHLDTDFIFHQRDKGKILQALKDYPRSAGVSFHKRQFVSPDRFNVKSRLVLGVNKKLYGDRIKFNGGGDLCQPTLDGRLMNIAEIPQAGVPFWNYEKIIKTKAQIMDDVGRMDRAYHRHFGEYLYSKDGTNGSAFKGWMYMVKGRYNKPAEKIKLTEHPKYMHDTIKNLTPDQFGFDGFGAFGANDYALGGNYA